MNLKVEELSVQYRMKTHQLENIRRNPAVSFTAYHMDGLLLDESAIPCDTNTAYQSIIAAGQAEMVTDPVVKKDILQKIIGKYTPQLSDVRVG